MVSTISLQRIKLLALLVLVLCSGCFYDSEAILYPDSTNCATTTAPIFNIDVLPLLNLKCNSCHSGSSPSAGIKLDTHSEIIKYVNDGTLMGSINHSSGFSPMPKNGSKMSACEILKIQNWINSAAPNN